MKKNQKFWYIKNEKQNRNITIICTRNLQIHSAGNFDSLAINPRSIFAA